MADLTDSDFIAMPFISDINAFRASQNPQMMPLKKNPEVEKGDIICPSSGEELYAHNFLNAYDWSLVNRLMIGASTNTSRPTVIEVPYSSTRSFFCNLSSSQITSSGFGPNTSGGNGSSKRIVFTSSIQESERTDLDYRENLLEYSPSTIEFPAMINNPLSASSLSSAFATAETNRQQLTYCSSVFPYSGTFVPYATAWQYSGTPAGRESGATKYVAYSRTPEGVEYDYTATPTQLSDQNFEIANLVIARSTASTRQIDTYDVLDFNSALASIGVSVSVFWQNGGGSDLSSKQITKVVNLGQIGNVTRNGNKIVFNQSSGIIDAINGIANELIEQLPTKDEMDDGYAYYYYELYGTATFMFYSKLKSIQ